ncbi:sarcosine oxidase subunit gamma [Puniceibacterium sp. IMCC21224]|uniref:sarcosine oxidase subunit gamma n=1 Tax=Puniceibacterium sp. IMCC21224 TaxID=1618204 RepID=UPI00064DDDC1|nr:sarcosine oxidase subunit gamma [Puniceibacterium sp. IMCC21224]KMK68436.1 sarcosine oxidase gamma subunit [Puniceibacterium sp. IMCC21224]
MTVQTQDMVPGVLAETSAAKLTLLPPVARFSLRARAMAVPALSGALGAELPARIGVRANVGDVEALCLGPDEWQILAPESAAPKLVQVFAVVYTTTPHSLTEISDRELTIRIDGPRAAELLTLGCPRDIDTIGAGQGRRTLFDGATVLIWRDGDQSFRMDIWRSFVPHVLSLLETGCRELTGD